MKLLGWRNVTTFDRGSDDPAHRLPEALRRRGKGSENTRHHGLAAGLLLICSALLAALSPVPRVWAEPAPGITSETAGQSVTDAPSPGAVASPPPAVLDAPDGSNLQIWASQETQLPVPPLTTSLASRSYVVGGMFNASVTSPNDVPRGVMEVGYQIGCGIDIANAAGVTITGTIGLTSLLALAPAGLSPTLSSPLGGQISVGLKPGRIETIPVTKKEYRSDKPWVMVQGFRIDVDGCVGESFVRSYAILSRSTDASDVIVTYFGETKAV